MVYSHVFEILLYVYSVVYLCIHVSVVLSALDGLYSSIIRFLSCWLYYFLPLSDCYCISSVSGGKRRESEKRKEGWGEQRESLALRRARDRETDESRTDVCVCKRARFLIVWRRVHMCGILNPSLITIQSGQTDHHRKFKVRRASFYTQRRRFH